MYYWQMRRSLEEEIKGLNMLEFGVDKWPDFAMITLMPLKNSVSRNSYNWSF